MSAVLAPETNNTKTAGSTATTAAASISNANTAIPSSSMAIANDLKDVKDAKDAKEFSDIGVSYRESEFHLALRNLREHLLILQHVNVARLRTIANTAHTAITEMQPAANFIQKNRKILDDVLQYIYRLEQNIDHANEGQLNNGVEEGYCRPLIREGNCKELAGYSSKVDILIYSINLIVGKTTIHPKNEVLAAPVPPANITSNENDPDRVFQEAQKKFSSEINSLNGLLSFAITEYIPKLQTAIDRTFQRTKPSDTSLWKILGDAIKLVQSQPNGLGKPPQLNRYALEIGKIEGQPNRSAMVRLPYHLRLATGKLAKLTVKFKQFETLLADIKRAQSQQGAAPLPRTFTVTKVGLHDFEVAHNTSNAASNVGMAVTPPTLVFSSDAKASASATGVANVATTTAAASATTPTATAVKH